MSMEDFNNTRAAGEILSERCQQLQAENKELKQDLLEFGRHSEGCCYIYDKVYGCKCGWLEVEQALKSK